MKQIISKTGMGILWLLKGLAKIVLVCMYLMLNVVKIFLMLFSVVFRIVFSFVKIGST